MLEIRDLHVSYDGIRALRGVSLKVERGEMVALIGPNGAGKTTLLNAASGILKSSSGSILLEGREISGKAAHRVARAGLIQVPEGRQMLGPMTVEENLNLGRQAAGARPERHLDRIYDLFPVLAERRQQLAGSLSGGQQQMVAIGRALMAQPLVLMLDEPSLGLAPIVVAQVFEALTALNRDGLTILVVEQNARRALAATRRAYILERGQIVHADLSARLAEDSIVAQHYLGTA